MFDHLVAANNLKEEFYNHGLNERDIIFIKEQIHGPIDCAGNKVHFDCSSYKISCNISVYKQ